MTVSKPNTEQEAQQCATVRCECPASHHHHNPPPEYSTHSSEASTTTLDDKMNTPLPGNHLDSAISIARDAAPSPGETFAIIHKASNRAIIRRPDGQVQLTGNPYDLGVLSIPQSNIDDVKWLCVERNGWLGFRSPSGRYMGQCTADAPGPNHLKLTRRVIEATAPHHRYWEFFCARRHPRGGYVLMTPIEAEDVETWLCGLWKLEVDLHATGKDGYKGNKKTSRLVIREDGGAQWEFVRIDAYL